jgi:thiol:disulfide interchange protein
MTRTPPPPGAWWLKILLFFGALVGAYFLNSVVQRHLGNNAREATGLAHQGVSDAMARAAEEHKLVLVKVSAVWCGRCRTVERKVLAIPEVKRAIERFYTFSRVEFDSAEGRAFRERYEVEGIPAFLLLRPDGSLIRPLPHTTDPRTFLRQLAEPSKPSR